MDEAEEDVLRTDVVVVEHACLFLRQDNDSAGSICKALKHL
jgi:predicted GNAT family N-acyltransferase